MVVFQIIFNSWNISAISNFVNNSFTYYILGVMLTVVFLMRALDPERYSDETESLLKRLVDCDGMRREYYRDLRM